MGFKKAIRIGNSFVGEGYPPFIVAEMSGNHNQSLKRALKIVDEAAKAGAHALKIQTYTADTMTLDIKKKGFLIKDAGSLWKGMTLYQLYRKAYMPWEWHKPIFDRCSKLGLVGFSTAFDATSVDFLESLDVPCYKIASFENTDLPLMRKIAATRKPVIISTGMATENEIREAIVTLRRAGCSGIILLKCTSAYPASAEGSNIRSIAHMRKNYKCQVGLSDHSIGLGVALAGVALGACLIEKHFTLRRSDGGVDAAFSLEPGELKSLVTEANRAWKSLGKVSYGPTRQEKNMLIFRRSVYVVNNLKAGEKFTNDNIKIIRPGFGLPPKYYASLIGRIAKKDLKKGTPLDWKLAVDNK